MEFKGTEGQWQANYSQISSKITIETDLDNIAEVFVANDTEREDKANALLISKAPELLECLKGLVSDVDNLLGEHDIEWQQAGYLSLAKELIKEATEL